MGLNLLKSIKTSIIYFYLIIKLITSTFLYLIYPCGIPAPDFVASAMLSISLFVQIKIKTLFLKKKSLQGARTVQLSLLKVAKLCPGSYFALTKNAE